MVELNEYKNLEEKMFYLGSRCKPLPEDPEQINRKYYNLGIEAYSTVMGIRHSHDQIDFISIDWNHPNNKKELQTIILSQLNTIKNQTAVEYNKIINNLSDENIPEIKDSKIVTEIRDWIDINYKLLELSLEKIKHF
jgi:hypothetical protein